MKILYSADLHIRVGQKNVPKEWQKNRFLMFFDKLKNIAVDQEAALIILGGDIFDRAPNLEELELYFSMITRLPVRTIIYDGNHEATKKGHTFLSNLKQATESINPLISVITEATQFKYLDAVLDIIPYTEIPKLKAKSHEFKELNSNIVCTHVRGNIPPHVLPEVDLDFFDRWDVVLAGDLHSYSNCQRNILYPGSPLTTSFHRKEVSTGVIIFDTNTLNHEWVELKLPQLIRKTVSSQEEIISTEFHHTIYEIEGSSVELADIDVKNDLVDKKLVKKDYTSTLILKDKTIAEELEIYLDKVRKFSKSEISKVIEVLIEEGQIE